MKVLIQFSNHDKKSEIITPFIGLENCQATDTELVVPGVIKIDYSNEDIKCFCLGLNYAEKILSNVCDIQIDSAGNNGLISFPSSLVGVILESTVTDFNKILELSSNGTVQYVNTSKKLLKSIVPLSQWMSTDLTIDNNKAYIKLKFNNYEISVSDGSAVQFCNRVKSHPLISASCLSKYFDFGNDIKIKPNVEYVCFWKVLKSENGYKKYSNFINDCKDRMNIIYDEGKKYRCEFDGGKVDFQLLSMGDKYPKKVVVQIHKIEDITIIESLQKCLGFNSIELISKVSNLKLTINKLLMELKFYKDEEFFIFNNIQDGFKAQYDIGNGVLTVKQEFKLSDKLDKNKMDESIGNMNKWIENIINNCE